MIVTISREFGSGGKYIGEKLSSMLGIRFYDKEILNAAAKKEHISEGDAIVNDERSRESYYEGNMIFPGHFKGSAPDDSIFQYEREFIRKLADREDCIVIGRCSNYVLRDADTIDVFVFSSDEAFKVKRKVKLENIEEGEARRKVKKTDQERAIYYQYHTGEIWGAKEHYDLCIDTSKTGVDTAANLIALYYKEKKEER